MKQGPIFELTGEVVYGDQRGRLIGFPTANILPSVPAPALEAGAYAALADGRPAAVNVGVRPTFEDASPGVVIEVHILDFEGDLYGRQLRVAFLEKLRDEQRFDGPDALVRQLASDIARVRAVCSAGE